MTAEQWQKIRSVVEDAMEIASEARPRFLARVCEGDEDLRREVESLLDFDDARGEKFEQNAFAVFLENGANTKNLIGKQIGSYKIVGELGAGGMGAVFLAERADGAFSQQVALKLIKRGMDSEAILHRFFNERQILASLRHPNIAHLVDGGTTDDNLPFFVMEYVEGETITDYAARENLEIEERLNLFREVCAAVSFAHQNLIVHRDLKPSNILITRDGNVKLLDFGIAKLLKSETGDATTATGNFVFTPEYASPEQVRGEKLATASDVYSLGVILYELLTGSRPFQTASRNIGEIIRAVCETEPVRPSSALSSKFQVQSSRRKTDSFETGEKSTAANKGQRTKDKEQRTNPKSKIRNPKSLKGDLDNIILKALRKEPERRYSSVEQFSEDVRRHQVGLPVTASRDTWNYRASKFIQRNRIGAAAASLILLSLLAGLGTTLYQANVARRERAKAERSLKDVRQMANSFMFEINDQIVKSPIKARELLAQRAVEYLDKLAAEAGDDAELESELATAYEKIGDVQSEVFKPNSGKTSDALASHQKSLQLRQILFAAEPSAARGSDVAGSYLRIGDIFLMTGNISETERNYRAAIQMLEPLLASDAKNYKIRIRLAASFARLGQAVLRSGSLGEARENYEKSLEINRNILAETPDNTNYQRAVGVVSSFLAFVNMEMGETEKAVNNYGNWLEIEKKIIEHDAESTYSRNNLSTAHIWFGVALNEHGKTADALAHLKTGVKIQEEVFAEDKENFGEQSTLGDCYLELGKIQVKNNLNDEAIEMLEKAIENYRAVQQKDLQNLLGRHRIASARGFLADAYFQKNNLPKASENYEQSLAEIKELTAADAENTDWQHDLAVSYQRIGKISLKKNDKAAALRNFETALPIFEKLSAKSPENVKSRKDLELIKFDLAALKNVAV